MFKVTYPGMENFFIERVEYVKKEGDLFVQSNKQDSDGIVYNGEFLLYKNGTFVDEVDAGEIYIPAEVLVQAIKEGVNSI